MLKPTFQGKPIEILGTRKNRVIIRLPEGKVMPIRYEAIYWIKR